MSLRDKQIHTLERMLHLNKDGPTDLTLPQTSEIAWKVLVLDRKARSVLSSVLRVNDLLRCGITVHALIDSKRSPLPDVPAIYFVEPTTANILAIMDDLVADRYESVYVNFASPIKRELLEEFAKKASVSGCAHKIKQVYDQYLDFVVTEPNLFSLDMPRVFTRLNSPNADEDAIHALVGDIAAGLLSTVATTGEIPILRAPQGGPAEYVATELDRLLREYVANSRTATTSNTPRPVLIILDRAVDLASMFSHSWIYQCMVADVFSLERNTIKIRKEENGQTTQKTYDVDPKDFFWAKYSQLPFPDVVENADVELNTYKKDAQDLTSRTGVSSLNDIDASQDTQQIQQAVDALPELTARKATLDMHMDILAALINELQAKGLDKYFEIEQSAADPKTHQEFLELLTSSQNDTAVDKLRTFLILVLLGDLSRDYISKIEAIFAEKYPEANLHALRYILKCKEVAKLTNITSLNDPATSSASHSGDSSALLSGLSSKLYGLTEGKISEGLTSIASKIKNFIPEKKQLPITNVVEAITDPQKASSASVSLTDDYMFFDSKSRGGHTRPPKRQTYSDATVFVIGGGNYGEYQNLQEWAGVSGKSVVYGATDIVSARGFLDECGELGLNRAQ